MFKVGDKVRINSEFGGMYDKLIGVVTENNPDKWYVRVEFDMPLRADNYDHEIKEEIFYPSELVLI